MLKEMSRALTECVRAPTEINVTPVELISRTVVRFTFPEPSVSTLPLMIPTACVRHGGSGLIRCYWKHSKAESPATSVVVNGAETFLGLTSRSIETSIPALHEGSILVMLSSITRVTGFLT